MFHSRKKKCGVAWNTPANHLQRTTFSEFGRRASLKKRIARVKFFLFFYFKTLVNQGLLLKVQASKLTRPRSRCVWFDVVVYFFFKPNQKRNTQSVVIFGRPAQPNAIVCRGPLSRQRRSNDHRFKKKATRKSFVKSGKTWFCTVDMNRHTNSQVVGVSDSWKEALESQYDSIHNDWFVQWWSHNRPL